MNEFELRRADHLDRVRRIAPSLPPDAAVSHHSAAVVLGYPLYTLPAPVKVTRTRGRAVRTSDVHVHIAQLRAQDRTVCDGIPITAGARTAVDLARKLPFREGLVVVDGALRRGVSRRQLGDVLCHQFLWPGILRAQTAIRHGDARAESALESVVRSRFIELGLPMPDLQIAKRDNGRFLGRVDFDFDEYGVIGEADGRQKYTDDELWVEKLRQEALEEAGYGVIRWTWQQAHAPDDEFADRLMRKLRRHLLSLTKVIVFDR